MRVLITTGPSYAPIDQVRRITNTATGHIGSILALRFLRGGYDVFLARGEGSTAPAPAWQPTIPSDDAPGLTVETFGTNEDLDELLKDWSGRHAFDAVFHTAALGDFRVKEIHYPQEPTALNDTGNHENHAPLPSMPAKIGSEVKALHLVLAPARKLLPRFRQRFGQDTKIVGWKYELDGTRDEAVAQAHQQIDKCQSNASVINGRAYGEGFGICLPGGDIHHCPDKDAVAEWLYNWLKRKRSASISAP